MLYHVRRYLQYELWPQKKRYGISLRVRRNAKKYGISDEVIKHAAHRDKRCVYCWLRFLLEPRNTRMDGATWEHMDGHSSEVWNIVLCCGSCNSSRGAQALSDWFASEYCRERSINGKTVAPVVQRYLWTGLRGDEEEECSDPRIRARIKKIIRIEKGENGNSSHPGKRSRLVNGNGLVATRPTPPKRKKST